MSLSIELESHHLDLIINILRESLPADVKIFFFGSRTTGRAKPFSDVDILIDAGRPLLLEELAKLNDKFDESLLPYKVDIADARTISESFKTAIQKQLVPVSNKP